MWNSAPFLLDQGPSFQVLHFIMGEGSGPSKQTSVFLMASCFVPKPMLVTIWVAFFLFSPWVPRTFWNVDSFHLGWARTQRSPSEFCRYFLWWSLTLLLWLRRRVYWQWFCKVFESPCSNIFHRIISVFNKVPSKGPKGHRHSVMVFILDPYVQRFLRMFWGYYGLQMAKPHSFWNCFLSVPLPFSIC